MKPREPGIEVIEEALQFVKYDPLDDFTPAFIAESLRVVKEQLANLPVDCPEERREARFVQPPCF